MTTGYKLAYLQNHGVDLTCRDHPEVKVWRRKRTLYHKQICWRCLKRNPILQFLYQINHRKQQIKRSRNAINSQLFPGGCNEVSELSNIIWNKKLLKENQIGLSLLTENYSDLSGCLKAPKYHKFFEIPGTFNPETGFFLVY